MVADEDVSLPLLKIFTAIGVVPDEVQLAENPRPQPKKFITDPSEAETKNKRQ